LPQITQIPADKSVPILLSFHHPIVNWCYRTLLRLQSLLICAIRGKPKSCRQAAHQWQSVKSALFINHITTTFSS